VFVHGEIPKGGETKTSWSGYWGETMYDYNNDRLIFKVPLRIGGGKTV
jgi:hypothetical protein